MQKFKRLAGVGCALVVVAVAARPVAAAVATVPTVTHVSPAQGPTRGGTTVTITGAAFAHVSHVWFGTLAATHLYVASSTRLTVTSPAHRAGTVDVRVQTSAGESANVLADHFRYIAVPTVSAVSPTSGPDVGGSSVRITGTAFINVISVKFGSTLGTSVHVSSSTSLTVRAPAHAAGLVDVRVATKYGTSVVTSADRFMFTKTSRVMGWGENQYSQLTLADTSTKATPVSLPALNGVSSVTVNPYGDGYALYPDGTVRAWGVNVFGSLGNGTNTDSVTPLAVPGLDHIVQLASTPSVGYALRSDGTVWAWGGDERGQLGDGTVITSGCLCRTTVGQVPGLTGITAIAAGEDNGFALRSDGTVWAWGSNQDAHLGDGTTQDRPSPVQVIGLSNVSAIASAGEASYALESDGTVWAWGCCRTALGDYTVDWAPTPIKMKHLSNVVAINGAMFAFEADGSVWSWAYNDQGSAGNGTTTPLIYPTKINSLTGFMTIAGANGSTFGIRSDGTVWAWGTNAYGQLGTGSPSTNTCRCIDTPTQPPALTGTTEISTAGLWTLAYHPPE